MSFHRGMCVRVSHCLALFESLFFPSGGSRAEMTLLRVRREERGKDYPDEDVADGWKAEERQQAQQQTAAKTIIINCKLTKRTENIAYNLPGGNCVTTHAYTAVSLPACGVIVKISFQYLQRLVMQPAISF